MPAAGATPADPTPGHNQLEQQSGPTNIPTSPSPWHGWPLPAERAGHRPLVMPAAGATPADPTLGHSQLEQWSRRFICILTRPGTRGDRRP